MRAICFGLAMAVTALANAAEFSMPQSSCAPNQLHMIPTQLRVATDGAPEMVVSCPLDCGRGGCPYAIFILSDKSYAPAGEFFGTYNPLGSSSHGFYDIEVSSRLGSDQTRKYVIQFNGKQYK